MQSLPERSTVSQKTALLLVAVSLNALEFFIPRIPFFPWLKPGLANCATIVWIIRFGTLDALLFSLLRVWTVGFYFGFSFLTLSLSLCGGVTATLVMGIAWSLAGKRRLLGTIGLAILGAAAHNAGQLAAVYVLLAQNKALFYQIPAMAAASVVFGTFIGLAAPLLWRLNEQTSESTEVPVSAPTQQRVSIVSSASVTALLLGSFTLAFVQNRPTLVATAVAATILAQIPRRGSLEVLLFPLRRFWMLFLFVGVLHGCLSYGQRLGPIPFLTREGLELAVMQWLRLWTWLQCTTLLKTLGFEVVFFGALRRCFPGREATLQAGVLALEHLPDLFSLAKTRADLRPSELLRHPVRSAHAAISAAYGRVAGLIEGQSPRQ